MYVDVHRYKVFSVRRYIALTPSVKLRIGSPKTARNEQGCAHAPNVIEEVNFPKHLWGCYARDGL